MGRDIYIQNEKIPTLLFYILLMTGVNGENILMCSIFLNTFKVEIEGMRKYQLTETILQYHSGSKILLDPYY